MITTLRQPDNADITADEECPRNPQSNPAGVSQMPEEANKHRPTVFIGSSREGLDVAKAIQQNLDFTCEVVLWSQGVFGLSKGALDSLVAKLPTFDFAVLVLTPDDMKMSRGDNQPSPRDNVLLELGMCIGALAIERTFIVYDRTSGIKLPSDLAGVTCAEYQPHSDGNLQAALGSPCTSIQGAIQLHGIRRPSKLSATIDIESLFQTIHDLVGMEVDQFIILMHERNITLQRTPPFEFSGGTNFKGYEYSCSNDAQLSTGIFSVDKLCKILPDAGLFQSDLRNNISLIERGHDYASWLIEHNHKAHNFNSPLGQWGDISQLNPLKWNETMAKKIKGAESSE